MKKRIFSLSFLSAFIAIIGIFLLMGCNHKHVLGDWEQKTPATCTEAEVLVRKCTGCDYYESKNGADPTGHDFSYDTTIIEPTEKENGYTLHSCHCGEGEKDNYKCLLTFESKTENQNINVSTLPQISQIIVNKDNAFVGVQTTTEFKPTEYRIYKTENYYTNIFVNEQITNSTKVTIFWELNEDNEPTSEEASFNEIIAKINKLEEISIKYNEEKNLSTNPEIRVLQYIRQSRYNAGTWNSIGGTLESDFNSYVQENQDSYDLASLKSINDITVPKTTEKIDFIHMLAAMNVIIKGKTTNNSTNDLVGWGGDLCQLALTLKETNLSGLELQEKAYSLFNNDSSTFSNQDLLADLDALNIGRIYENLTTEQKSISYAIKEYYNVITSTTRRQMFLNIALPNFIDLDTGELTKSQEVMASEIVDRLSNNLYLQIWCMKNGVSFSSNHEAILASAMAFVKYFI